MTAITRRLTAALLLLLSATAAAAPVKLALPGLNAVQLDPKLGDFLNEQLGVELARRGAEVVTTKEIATLLGYERQRQLLSCEESNCVAELGNALGADALVTGDVARVGTRYQLTVKALSTTTGKSFSSWTGGADSEEALLKLVAQAAASLAPEVSKATGKPLGEVRATANEKSARDYALYPAIAGGVLIAGGVVAEVIAYGHYQRLTQPGGLPHAEAVQAASSGKSMQTLFAIGVTAGAAALATAGAMYFLGGDSAVSAAVTPDGGGIYVTVALR